MPRYFRQNRFSSKLLSQGFDACFRQEFAFLRQAKFCYFNWFEQGGGNVVATVIQNPQKKAQNNCGYDAGDNRIRQNVKYILKGKQAISGRINQVEDDEKKRDSEKGQNILHKKRP